MAEKALVTGNPDFDWNSIGKKQDNYTVEEKEKLDALYSEKLSTIEDLQIIEGVVGQTLLYYPISIENTNFHPLYGEAIEKSFLPPVRVYARVVWEGYATETTNLGVDRRSTILVHFHTLISRPDASSGST